MNRCFSYIGIVDSMPGDAEKALAGIEGYSIYRIKQVNNDRILFFELNKRDRLGKTASAGLIFEIMPNHGDVYFVDNDLKIKSSLRRNKHGIYSYPSPLKKPTILDIDEPYLRSILENKGDPAKEFYGLNSRDILNLSLSRDGDQEEILHDMREYVAQAAKPGTAWAIRLKDGYSGFSLVNPRLLPDESTVEFESALAMYEQYYSSNSEENAAASNLIKILKNEIAKTEKRISKIKAELSDAENADLYSSLAELILANINNIPKGADSVNLKSLGDDSGLELEIKLNPSKSASANAKEYFRKAKKARASKDTLEKRLSDSEKYFTRLLDLHEGSIENTEDLGAGLRDLGLLAEKKAKPKKPEPRKPYRSFRASCGWEILIGKSNRDNDELTFHIAAGDDYWFHAWQAAGSHTVLRLPDKSSKPDKQTLMEAASLAAWFSKARNSSKVPVAYTQVKYVRKPRKFPPGKVLIEREKELMVRPADPDDYAKSGSE